MQWRLVYKKILFLCGKYSVHLIYTVLLCKIYILNYYFPISKQCRFPRIPTKVLFRKYLNLWGSIRAFHVSELLMLINKTVCLAAEVTLICLCVTQIFTLLKIAQDFIINALKGRKLVDWCEEQVPRRYLPRFLGKILKIFIMLHVTLF